MSCCTTILSCSASATHYIENPKKQNLWKSYLKHYILEPTTYKWISKSSALIQT